MMRRAEEHAVWETLMAGQQTPLADAQLLPLTLFPAFKMIGSRLQRALLRRRHGRMLGVHPNGQMIVVKILNDNIHCVLKWSRNAQDIQQMFKLRKRLNGLAYVQLTLEFYPNNATVFSDCLLFEERCADDFTAELARHRLGGQLASRFLPPSHAPIEVPNITLNAMQHSSPGSLSLHQMGTVGVNYTSKLHAAPVNPLLTLPSQNADPPLASHTGSLCSLSQPVGTSKDSSALNQDQFKKNALDSPSNIRSRLQERVAQRLKNSAQAPPSPNPLWSDLSPVTQPAALTSQASPNPGPHLLPVNAQETPGTNPLIPFIPTEVDHFPSSPSSIPDPFESIMTSSAAPYETPTDSNASPALIDLFFPSGEEASLVRGLYEGSGPDPLVSMTPTDSIDQLAANSSTPQPQMFVSQYPPGPSPSQPSYASFEHVSTPPQQPHQQQQQQSQPHQQPHQQPQQQHWQPHQQNVQQHQQQQYQQQSQRLQSLIQTPSTIQGHVHALGVAPVEMRESNPNSWHEGLAVNATPIVSPPVEIRFSDWNDPLDFHSTSSEHNIPLATLHNSSTTSAAKPFIREPGKNIVDLLDPFSDLVWKQESFSGTTTTRLF